MSWIVDYLIAPMAGIMMLAFAMLVTVWYLAICMGKDERFSRHALGVTCTVFQIGHLIEHTIQLGAWGIAPENGMPWMSPVAYVGEKGLAIIGRHPGNMAVGMEMLHFIGNWIFLIGLMTWASQFSHPWLTFAVRLQSLHVLEHVALTLTVFIHGSPIGLSTLFGYAATLPWTFFSDGGYRIWFHFLANAVATIATVGALAYWRRAPAPEVSYEPIHA
jgi:hypothetical protein